MKNSIYRKLCTLNCFSRVQLCVTLWTVALQAPLSMGFSKQEYWRGLPFPPPGDPPNPGIEPPSPALTGRFFTTEPPGKPHEGMVFINLTGEHPASMQFVPFVLWS